MFNFNDNPVSTPGEDLLNTQGYVNFLIEDYLCDFSLFKENGYRFGITGRWGSGKTSLLNLFRATLENSEEFREKVIFITLNPWHLMNGPQSSILDVFLRELYKNLSSLRTDAQKDELLAFFRDYSASLLTLEYVLTDSVNALEVDCGIPGIIDKRLAL